jgi:hypothetical protein
MSGVGEEREGGGHRATDDKTLQDRTTHHTIPLSHYNTTHHNTPTPHELFFHRQPEVNFLTMKDILLLRDEMLERGHNG